MSLPPTILPADDADQPLQGEVLPPERTVNVSTQFGSGPDISAQLIDLGQQITEVLRIPDNEWPRNRKVSLSIDMVIVPSRIRATITNTSDNE